MKSIKHLLLLMCASLSLVTSPFLLAHTDEYLDAQKTPHGGQLRMAGIYHFELVMNKDIPQDMKHDMKHETQHETQHDAKPEKGNQVLVYVTDHAGTKIATAGATGTATILSGKQKLIVKLLPDGENNLKGVGKAISGADVKVVVMIKLAGKPAEQARFTPQTAANPHAH
jgi:hypothetical protein